MFLEGYIPCPYCNTSNGTQIVIPFWKLFGIRCRECKRHITPEQIRKWSDAQAK